MDRLRITTQTLVVLSMLLRDPMAEWYGFELADHAKLKSGTLTLYSLGSNGQAGSTADGKT